MTADVSVGCAVHLVESAKLVRGGVKAMQVHRVRTHSDTSNPLMSYLGQWDDSLQFRCSLLILRCQLFTVATPTHYIFIVMKAKFVLMRDSKR